MKKYRVENEEENMLAGAITVILLSAMTWFGWKISMPFVWIPPGSILVMAFAGGFIDAFCRRHDWWQESS